GFAASTYQRGAHFLQIPTTLLAQVDASVGGKTAINHVMGKNMIGSFYQPHAVLIDVETLKTLPEREFRAGLAEIIKYGLLVGGAFLDHLTDALKNGLNANSAELAALIAQCCNIKADYVVADETEQGLRALLNLGHTVAHALESYTDYKVWLHGEAVAIGLYCAALLSYHAGLANASLVARVEQLLNYAQLPHKIPRFVDIAKIKQFMMLDKKIKNNRLRFIVIKKPGDCAIDDSITAECLDHTLNNAVSGD
ncbi:MAG: 3-dehydroquinate synthase, partial [Legionella sp.]